MYEMKLMIRYYANQTEIHTDAARTFSQEQQKNNFIRHIPKIIYP